MIRAVVDTSVYVSAFIGRPSGAPARLLAAARDRRVVLVASPLLVAELEGVLSRPKFARLAVDGRAITYVTGIAALAEQHPDPEPAEAPLTRDPEDEYLIALAVASGADVLVSLDADLLDPELPVPCVRPAELLDRL